MSTHVQMSVCKTDERAGPVVPLGDHKDRPYTWPRGGMKRQTRCESVGANLVFAQQPPRTPISQGEVVAEFGQRGCPAPRELLYSLQVRGLRFVRGTISL